jgi:very-short-patch-repair endonuclease
MAYQQLDHFLFYLTNNTNWDVEQTRERLGLPESEPRRGLSPIERQFLAAWEKTGGPKITVQHRVAGEHGQYRLDFALVEEKIAIELDGRRNHCTTEQIAQDHKRQRDIEALGWRVIRFGGKEIAHDVEGCVAEVQRILGEAIL